MFDCLLMNMDSLSGSGQTQKRPAKTTVLTTTRSKVAALDGGRQQQSLSLLHFTHYDLAQTHHPILDLISAPFHPLFTQLFPRPIDQLPGVRMYLFARPQRQREHTFENSHVDTRANLTYNDHQPLASAARTSSP